VRYLERIPPWAAMLCIIFIAFIIAALIPKGYRSYGPGFAAIPDASISSGGGLRERVPGKRAPEVDPTPEVFIEVNIPATELTLYEDGVPLFRRRIAIGRGIYPTPQQVSAIERIEWNPWWYPPDAPWAKNDKPTPPGPRNPLGVVKLPLSQEILFHGTNAPWSVGRPASHGCMRMHNRDVSELAWYLQERFSEQRDPSLREEYRKYRWKTFKVILKRPVPVEIVYRPVVARDGLLSFYRDHYNRVAGSRKAAIITELMRAGYEIDGMDDEKIKGLSREWPVGKEVLIMKLMREPREQIARQWPECS
jgi:hypothetical protein